MRNRKTHSFLVLEIELRDVYCVYLGESGPLIFDYVWIYYVITFQTIFHIPASL